MPLSLQVPFAMLADMFNTFSFSKLLQATQNSTTEVAKQESSESKEATALKHIWEGPEALQKAQVRNEETRQAMEYRV